MRFVAGAFFNFFLLVRFAVVGWIAFCFACFFCLVANHACFFRGVASSTLMFAVALLPRPFVVSCPVLPAPCHLPFKPCAPFFAPPCLWIKPFHVQTLFTCFVIALVCFSFFSSPPPCFRNQTISFTRKWRLHNFGPCEDVASCRKGWNDFPLEWVHTFSDVDQPHTLDVGSRSLSESFLFFSFLWSVQK